MAPDSNQETQRNTVEARQGSARPKVIYVLVAAIVLIVVVFALTGTFVKH